MIFWASMTKGERSDPKQIIYRSRTKDFKEFSEPEIYIERENHVTDTTIFKEDNYYYRFSKDETKKCIILEKSRDLSRHNFINVESSDLISLLGGEGPALFKFNDRNEWCLLEYELLMGAWGHRVGKF